MRILIVGATGMLGSALHSVLGQDTHHEVWGTIRNFTFVTDQLHCARYGELALWLGCPWISEAPGSNGDWRHRPGRITAVLENRNGRWLAVHTHHSLVPIPT